MNIHYKLEFFSYWHCGSGLSAGADVDLLTIKDEDGLPFVPGKTIKGLLREASETLAALAPDKYPVSDVIEKIYGKANDSKSPEPILQGCAFFSNAGFPKEDKDFILKNKYTQNLFTSVSSTAIDDAGIAEEHSLRRTEVALPCVLVGEVLNLPEDGGKLMYDSMAFVKRLGANRNRGLGRCRFTVTKTEVSNG